MALFEHEVRSCTVRAAGAVRVLTVDRRRLMGRIQPDPSLAFRILERMSDRLREMDAEIDRLKSEMA